MKFFEPGQEVLDPSKAFGPYDLEPINDRCINCEEIKKIINQQIPNTKPKIIFKEKSIPTYVATPLPPLNFNHIGKTCPKKTLKAAI